MLFRTSPVTIHGLGAAISKAVDIANAVCAAHQSTLELSVTTSTIPVADDFEPVNPDLPVLSQIRLTSAIHITLSPALLSSQRQK